MSFTERLALIITANADQALREINKVGGQAERDLGKATTGAERFASSSLKIGAGLVAAGGLALPMLARLGQGASDLNEQISGSTVVFRQNATQVQRWAKDLDGSFGISQRAALTAANNFGAMFTGLGLGVPKATDMSKSLVELASDLASFKNLAGGSEEALERLRSGLAGEAEPLRRMDIFLNEAAVSAKAMELGIAGVGDKLTDSQKVQARYALILEQSSLAQGDFARTSDSLANSQRIAAAEAENAKNAFGQGVVGPMTAATKAVGGLASGLGDLSPQLASTVGTIATVGAATAVGVGGLALLSGGVIKARDAFKNAEGGLNNFGKTAKGLGVIAGVAGTLFAVAGAADALGLSARGLEVDIVALGKATDRELVSAFTKLQKLPGEASKFFDALPLDQAQRLVSALKATGEETGHLEVKIRSRAKAEAEAAASTDEAKGALEEIAGATEDAATEADEAADAFDEFTQASDRLFGSLLGEREAAIQLADKIAALGESIKENGSQTGLATEKQRALTGSLIDVVQAAQREVDAITKSGQISTDAAAQKQALIDRLEQVKQKYPQLSGPIQEYINKIRSIPDSANTTITANTTPARKTIADFVADVKRDLANIVATPLASRTGVTPRAHGGVTTGLTLVGEEGPELINVGSTPHYVTDAKTTAEFLAPAATGTTTTALVPVGSPQPASQSPAVSAPGTVEQHFHQTVEVYVAGSVVAERDLGEIVLRELRTYIQRNGGLAL